MLILHLPCYGCMWEVARAGEKCKKCMKQRASIHMILEHTNDLRIKLNCLAGMCDFGSWVIIKTQYYTEKRQ